MAAAFERKAPLYQSTNFQSIPGKGVAGTVNGRHVALGNTKLMDHYGLALDGLEAKADEFRRVGATALFVAVDGTPSGLLGIADPIKATTQSAITSLKGAADAYRDADR